jgi:DNA-binding NarL/FixJ family response regulator
VIASDPVTQRRIAGLLGEHGWAAIPSDYPDSSARVILACVDLGVRSAPDYLRAIREDAPDSALVVLSPRVRGNDVRRAIRAGVDGIVFDAQLEGTLGPAVQAVCAGMAVVPREARNHVERPVLSYREKQILNLVVAGLTNRQIGERLYLAESTVKTHLTTAFGKLGVRSRSEAAAVLLDPAEPLLAGVLVVEDQVAELTV